jgi:hypothetical protein
MKLNRGAGSQWTAMEREWVQALKDGNKVAVKIEINWPTGASRPRSFDVNYSVAQPSGKVTVVRRSFVNR